MSSSCDRTHTVTVGMIKTAIECITSQSLENKEFLVELTLKDAAALLIEEVFDVNEFHTNCHPLMAISLMSALWAFDHMLRTLKFWWC